VEKTDIDSFDVSILNCLQKNVRMTSEEMAKSVGLSATACQRRVKRLRQSGAIQAEIAVISPDVVGGRVTMIVQVALRRGGADIIDDFRRDIAKTEEVQQCYYVLGDYDFTLVISAKDIAEYDRLSRRIFFNNNNIQKFHTTVALETVKVGLNIPLS